jgi:hypothetical protein
MLRFSYCRSDGGEGLHLVASFLLSGLTSCAPFGGVSASTRAAHLRS